MFWFRLNKPQFRLNKPKRLNKSRFRLNKSKRLNKSRFRLNKSRFRLNKSIHHLSWHLGRCSDRCSCDSYDNT